jgi:hypothetical protein
MGGAANAVATREQAGAGEAESGAPHIFSVRNGLVTTRGKEAEALLAKAKDARAFDPSIFDDHEAYFWRSIVSNAQLDAYFTRMGTSSLKNYEADAQDGIAFQDSHKTDGVVRTLGHSLNGTYYGPRTRDGERVEVDFYTLLGIDPAIDAYVSKLRAGISRDVSIGFYGGQWICSLCGRDMLTDWDCWHWPGIEGRKLDKDGKPTDELEVCTATVENAHMAETSGVYDGACPGAMVTKAYRAIEAGQLAPQVARQLEASYRIRLPGARHAYGVELDLSEKEPNVSGKAENEREQPKGGEGSGIEIKAGEGSATIAVSAERENELRSEGEGRALGRVRQVLVEFGVDVQNDDMIGAIRTMCGDVQRMKPLAADGERYKADLVKEALEEGVRAMGDGFESTTYEATLKAAPIDFVKRMRDDWRSVGDKRFAGGRQTTEGGEKGGGSDRSSADEVPAAAFKS